MPRWPPAPWRVPAGFRLAGNDPDGTGHCTCEEAPIDAMRGPTDAGAAAGPAQWPAGSALPPFCGDEYPPLKGSPGAVVCTRPSHPATERHLNEETGWVWRTAG